LSAGSESATGEDEPELAAGGFDTGTAEDVAGLT